MKLLNIKTNILVIVSLTLLFLGCSSQSQIQDSVSLEDSKIMPSAEGKTTSKQGLAHSENLNQSTPKNETINLQSDSEYKIILEGNISREEMKWGWSFSAIAGDRIRIIRITPDGSLIDFHHVEVSLYLDGLEQIIGKDADLNDVLLPKTAIYNLVLRVGDYETTHGDFVIELRSQNELEVERNHLFQTDPLDSLAQRVDSRLGGCVISNGLNGIPKDLRIIGPITRTNDVRPFSKKMIAYGITLISGDDVSDEFMIEIAEIIEEIFSEHPGTNSELQDQLLGNLHKYRATIPIFNGEPYFLKSSHWIEYEFLKKNNSICDVIKKHEVADKYQANEIVEHLLHIISDVGLLYTFPDKWGIGENSLIYSIMLESIEEEVFNVDNYFIDGFPGEEEIVRRIFIQEFAYWGILSFWDLISEIAPDDFKSEWKVGDAEELKQKIPRFEILLKKTVAEVMGPPKDSLVTFLEIKSSHNFSDQNQSISKDEKLSPDFNLDHQRSIEGEISREEMTWAWSFSGMAGDRVQISRISPEGSSIDLSHIQVILYVDGLRQVIWVEQDLKNISSYKKDFFLPKTGVYNLVVNVINSEVTNGPFVIELRSSNRIEIEPNYVLFQSDPNRNTTLNSVENDAIILTHINGDLIPKLTSAGSDECDNRIEESPFCVEILSYEGVSQIAVDQVINGMNALADYYIVREEELQKPWSGFGPDGGLQNYVGVILWHSEKSDREMIKKDACQFRIVASAPNVPSDDIQCIKSIDAALEFSEQAAMHVSGTKANNGFIIYFSEYAWKWYPTGRLHNKLNDPRKISAHEFMHSYQATHTNNMTIQSPDLIPNEGPVWFVEGSAEYAAIRSTALKGWGNWRQMVNFHYALISSTVSKFPEISISMNETRADRKSLESREYAHVLTYEMGFWAVAFAISISSHDAVMVDYWDDIEEFGPTGSFEKNVGVDLETFYMLFYDFMELDKEVQVSEILNQIN